MLTRIALAAAVTIGALAAAHPASAQYYRHGYDRPYPGPRFFGPRFVGPGYYGPRYYRPYYGPRVYYGPPRYYRPYRHYPY